MKKILTRESGYEIIITHFTRYAIVFLNTVVYFFILKEVKKNENSSKQKQEK